MIAAATLLVHLLSFAAYVGAGFAQLQMMKRSVRPGTSPDTCESYEQLAAATIMKIEVPAIFVSIGSGILFIAQSPILMKQGWLHGKITCVLFLALLSHLEMFNARAIVKARAKGDKASLEEIGDRKKRHTTLGSISFGLVVVVMFLVTFIRLGAFRP